MIASEWSMFGKLALAALLGALIGAERDLHGRPAGLRTTLLIAVGSCLFAILSREGFADAQGTQDPTRIASIVVQGIGFLGAGVLLKGDGKIVGLTTAAAIWLVAAVGLAVGAGRAALAIFATGFSLAMILLLEPLSERLERAGKDYVRRKGGKVIEEE
jgi:putative Mg2+ transporter-C (MgtC) family protein